MNIILIEVRVMKFFSYIALSFIFSCILNCVDAEKPPYSVNSDNGILGTIAGSAPIVRYIDNGYANGQTYYLYTTPSCSPGTEVPGSSWLSDGTTSPYLSIPPGNYRSGHSSFCPSDCVTWVSDLQKYSSIYTIRNDSDCFTRLTP